jgi:hypothetical protein
VIGAAIDPKLIPRTHEGSEQVWTRGQWCVMYRHPDDAYALPIFNNISLGRLGSLHDSSETL